MYSASTLASAIARYICRNFSFGTSGFSCCSISLNQPPQRQSAEREGPKDPLLFNATPELSKLWPDRLLLYSAPTPPSPSAHPLLCICLHAIASTTLRQQLPRR